MKTKKPRENKPRRWDAILKRLPCGVDLVGAEIGVLNANTSYRILQARPRLTLIMVDPWEVPAAGSSYEVEADTNAQKPQDAHEAAYQKTLQLVKFAGKRARIYRKYSHEIAPTIADRSLDFVFIDGDHSYKGCSKDIALWMPKIKVGGWIGGHDYDHPKLPGVSKAVDEVFEVVETDVNRTWFKKL